MNATFIRPLTTLPLTVRTKIIGVILLFLMIALVSIGITLWLSWHQEGGAAAINDAGSLRMRATRMALNAQRYRDHHVTAMLLRQEMIEFDALLDLLQTGDSQRPLLVPAIASIQSDLRQVGQVWRQKLKPQLQAIISRDNNVQGNPQQAQLEALAQATASYVTLIDRFVSNMEQHNADYTTALRLMQILLAGMAVLGTVVMIYLMTLIVLRPLQQLHMGIRRLAAGDYAVRVRIETRDELGQLGSGFNLMANRLANVHATLEEQVRTQMASLKQKNHELALLYEVTAFFNQSATLEELYQGFIQRVSAAFSAGAAVVRLYHPPQKQIFWAADTRLEPSLKEEEICMHLADCLCGSAVREGKIMLESTPQLSGRLCSRYGYQGIAAFPIVMQNRVLGVFSLLFTGPIQLDAQQVRLITVLGQHFAVAIENLRLEAKSRELAVLEERNLVAQSLHDSIAQGLSFLNLQTQIMEQAMTRQDSALMGSTLALLKAGVEESYDDVRELLNNFRAKLADSFVSAIAGVLDRFQRQSGIRVEFRTGNSEEVPLVAEQQLQLLFIVQEALSNIRKHARATLVVVALHDDGKELRLSVADNGVGFVVADSERQNDTHLGLSIMRERACRAGCSLQVESQPGQGTRIQVLLEKAHRIVS